MHTVEEETTLVACSELRTRFKEVLKAMEHSRVVLEKRSRPVAVLVPPDRYRRMEELLEMIEDRALGYLARKRDKKTREKDYLTLDEAEKKVGLR